MTDNRIDKMLNICVLWNKHEVTGDKGMYEIYKLFKPEFLKKWREDVRKRVVNKPDE